MTLEEMSNLMDVYLNSQGTKTAFGNELSTTNVALDEYEKSVLLTKAQNDIVLGLYNGLNVQGDSFETTEEARRYLADLVEEDNLLPIKTLNGSMLGIDSNSKFFTLPDDVWFITYESVKLSEGERCAEGSILDVYPVTQDEYHRIKRNPFRGANKRRALRLDLSEGIVEIVCKYKVKSYYIRYMRKLNPIILTDLMGGLSIEGLHTRVECELHESLHHKIVDRAVTLAQSVKVRQTTKSDS